MLADRAWADHKGSCVRRKQTGNRLRRAPSERRMERCETVRRARQVRAGRRRVRDKAACAWRSARPACVMSIVERCLVMIPHPRSNGAEWAMASPFSKNWPSTVSDSSLGMPVQCDQGRGWHTQGSTRAARHPAALPLPCRLRTRSPPTRPIVRSRRLQPCHACHGVWIDSPYAVESRVICEVSTEEGGSMLCDDSRQRDGSAPTWAIPQRCCEAVDETPGRSAGPPIRR